MKKAKTPPADPKLTALRRSGTLHPHPDRVTAPLFAQHDFFDPRDTLQVKYEMLRSVQIEGQSVRRTVKAFGCSRPTFYQALAAFTADGLAGLLPQKRGPQQAHKLSEEMYKKVAEEQAAKQAEAEGAAPGPDAGPEDASANDDVIDADYEVKD